jgi:hypothetical protein
MSRKLFALALGVLAIGLWAQAGTVLAEDHVVGDSCGRDGCGRRGCPHDGVCVPYTQTKVVEHRCYTDVCEQFCLPRCGGLFGHGGGDCDHGACHDGASHDGACHDGNCNQCGHPCVRKYLIVKIKKEEQCVPACKVEHEAGCAAPVHIIQPPPAKQMPAAKPTAAARPLPQMQVIEYRYMPIPQK